MVGAWESGSQVGEVSVGCAQGSPAPFSLSPVSQDIVPVLAGPSSLAEVGFLGSIPLQGERPGGTQLSPPRVSPLSRGSWAWPRKSQLPPCPTLESFTGNST